MTVQLANSHVALAIITTELALCSDTSQRVTVTVSKVYVIY